MIIDRTEGSRDEHEASADCFASFGHSCNCKRSDCVTDDTLEDGMQGRLCWKSSARDNVWTCWKARSEPCMRDADATLFEKGCGLVRVLAEHFDAVAQTFGGGLGSWRNSHAQRLVDQPPLDGVRWLKSP